MKTRYDRRAVLGTAAAFAAASCVPLRDLGDPGIQDRLGLLERELGGRLGIAFFDPGENASLAYRGDERFPLASTFKASLAGFALALEQDGEIDLSERVLWTEKDLIFHTPFTGERIGTGATLRELAKAAQKTSDNLAANLVLRRVGGPPALTAFWRSLGDKSSRLDRYETALNLVPPGDIRDTTTPSAMATSLSKMLGPSRTEPLGPDAKEELRGWMIDSITGLKKVRAGLPQGWVAGDKTGNSGGWEGAMGYLRGDIGFVDSPTGSPVFFAAYHQSPPGDEIESERVDRAFAAIGGLLTRWIRRNYTIVLT